MQVKHPQYGVGTVKAIAEHTAEVKFDDGVRTLDPLGSNLEAAEPQATLTELTLPLRGILKDFAEFLSIELGMERPDSVVESLGTRWHDGTLVLRPADRTVQSKEVPIDVFFHKIVMMRNNLRVLEQKVNAHKVLSDTDKVDLQQFITRCYGSMTSFNVLFRHKEDQFSTKGD